MVSEEAVSAKAAADAVTEAAAQDKVVPDVAHDGVDDGACMDPALVEKEREILKAELEAAEKRLLVSGNPEKMSDVIEY